MKILSVELSDKTAELVRTIETAVRLPVQYYPVEQRPNAQDHVAGAVDAHGYDGIYKVWLSESNLSREEFEVNLLHELRHIVQIQSGFSSVYNKYSDDFYSDREFVEEVGAHLSSVILDLEVNSWLSKNGYSPSSFEELNYKQLIIHSNVKYTELDDPLNFTNLVLALFHVSVYVDDAQAQKLFDAYTAYPDAIKIAAFLRNHIRSNPITNTHTAILGHCLLIDSLNLWKYYYVMTPSTKIRTRADYRSYCSRSGETALPRCES